MIKIAVIGVAGRMGGAIIHALETDQAVTLGCALEHIDSPALGQDAGVVANTRELGVPIISSPEAQDFDIMIDFSTPASSLKNIEYCRRADKAIIIGTTGMDQEMMATMRQAAKDIPILFSANFSVGVNLTAKLLKMAATVIGNETDIEVIEAHHKQKVDAPSGTALLLGEAIAEALDKDLAQDAVYSREGYTGKRKEGSIGFSAIRGGQIIGEHTVMFIGESERIEITHRASDRKIYALGSIRAAKWLQDKPAGLYDMNDVLGLRDA